jgi:target of rapamycin complex subunit LST8
MSVILATAGYDHKIRFWEAPSGICSRILKYPDSQVNKLEITPDKQFLAAGGNPHIRLYEIAASVPAPPGVGGVGPPGGGGGGGVGSAGTSGVGTENQQPVLTLEGHTSSVTSLGFQRDGRYLYSGSEDGTIKLWDLRNPTYSRSLDCHAPVRSVTLRVDRDEIISGDANGNVKVWDLGGNGKGPINQVQPGADSGAAMQSSIQAVDISDDSRTLVAVSNHGTVFVWDPSQPVSGQPTNNSTAIGYTNSNNNINNVNNGGGHSTHLLENPLITPPPPHSRRQAPHVLKPITKFRAHALGTYCLHAKISPDCRHLCTTGSDGSAKLWDTTTWELSQNLQEHSKWVWDAAFCADSSYLVTASSDNTARLWNLRTGEVVRQYVHHQSAVTCVALNDSSL